MADGEGRTLDPEITAYYDRGFEQVRLATISRLEFVRTMELLVRFLPPAPAAVLDVGGGSGVYATKLLEEGYAVTLVDPVPLHVEQAKAAGVADAVVGDARTLEFDDGSFDAVLLLGPLYHLVERDGRLRALREARRVLRPGGVVCAAVISRFASTFNGLTYRFLDEPAFEEIVERDLADGVHLNPERRRGWFTTAYFHHPDEVGAELRDAGLAADAVVAIEGPGEFAADLAAWLDDAVRRETLLRAIRRVEAEPTLIGAGGHILAVGRRA